MERSYRRADDAMRPVRIVRRFTKYAEGSVLIEMGDTRVVCTASVEAKVPPFLRGTGKGWVTAEYGMLPRSTAERTPREAARGRLSGRTQEIQRLIGRSLRSVVDHNRLGERTITVDCDVLQADGGTRTAAITGAYVALVECLESLFPLTESSEIGDGHEGSGRGGVGGSSKLPVFDLLSAVSVGIVDGRWMLDLDYGEDCRAEVDMNVVGTGGGRLVEVQGTAEGAPFTRKDMDCMLDLAQRGIAHLTAVQREVLGEATLARFSAPAGSAGAAT